MNKGIKILLDIIMTICMLLIMSLSTTGILVHELLGLGIFLIFVFHKFLNWSWISSITKTIFNNKKDKKIKLKTKIMYLLNSAILVSVTTATLTGIWISQSVFTYISVLNGNFDFWTPIHLSASYTSLILISVHIGFHWKGMMGSFKKMFDLREKNKSRIIIARVLAAGLVLLGIKYSISKQVGDIIITPFLPVQVTQKQSYVQSETIVKSPTYLATSPALTDSITLEEFLGKMICTLCSKRCSLLRPRCSRGTVKVKEATAQYNAMILADSASSKASSSNSITPVPTVTPTIQPKKQTTTNSTSTSENTASTNTDTTQQDNTQNESIVQTSSLEDSSFAFLPIMSVYIAGTHYLITLSEKRRVKKSE